MLVWLCVCSCFIHVFIFPPFFSEEVTQYSVWDRDYSRVVGSKLGLNFADYLRPLLALIGDSWDVSRRKEFPFVCADIGDSLAELYSFSTTV